MPAPLLRTKLHIPPVRKELVSRPRLIEQLNAGLDRKLTLISAPAGFGKTTLLCEWVQALGDASPPTAIAWLSLDEGDNDPALLLAYLVAALQTTNSSVGEGIVDALQSPGPVSVEAVLYRLLNEIAEFPEQVVLVLDDYHLIESQSVDRALTLLLENLPSQLHLVIASRIDPSLPVSRLRSRMQMAEIRVEQLRFSPEEAAAFLNQVMGLELSTHDVVALEERTEGWIAGLQLAALSMQGLKRKDEIAAFVNRFTGSDHYIQDYLTDEVLQQRPEGTRSFLLQTSILDRMSGPLCDAVTGMDDSQAILETLEASNLFIVPLDNERRWYRYHHLFADLLQSRLRRFHPDRLTTLHVRAAEWFEENSLVAEAVDHALAGRDYGRAASLIEQAATATMNHGRVTTILRWLQALPESILDARPRLGLYRAWAFSMAGQPRAAERMLLDARSALAGLPPSPENLALRGELGAILAGVITSRNDPPRIIREAEEALTYLPEEKLLSRARASIALGIAYAYSDELDKATETFQQTRDMALGAKNPFLVATAIELLSGIQSYHQGRLRAAAQNLTQILELGRATDGTLQAFTGMAHGLLAEINLEWNDLEAASHYLEKGIELVQQGGVNHSLIHTYCAQARLNLALGERDRAVEALRSADQAARATPMVQFLVHNLACQVNLSLHLGDTETALQWATGARSGLPESLPAHLHEFQQIALARVYLAQGDLEETVETLNRIHRQAESAGRMAHVIVIDLLKALANQDLGDTTAAIECLESSLSFAAPEGYVRTFVDHGAPMAQLLNKAAVQGIMPQYTGKLLSAFGVEQRAGTPPPQSLVEPLSPRELEVLQLLAKGLSNREIGERLFLALDTVKGHNYRIYSKLAVKNRTQAVNKALALKIIRPQKPQQQL
jgi:LuxR family maltose regulon positive regulatory protein